MNKFALLRDNPWAKFKFTTQQNPPQINAHCGQLVDQQLLSYFELIINASDLPFKSLLSVKQSENDNNVITILITNERFIMPEGYSINLTLATLSEWYDELVAIYRLDDLLKGLDWQVHFGYDIDKNDQTKIRIRGDLLPEVLLDCLAILIKFIPLSQSGFKTFSASIENNSVALQLPSSDIYFQEMKNDFTKAQEHWQAFWQTLYDIQQSIKKELAELNAEPVTQPRPVKQARRTSSSQAITNSKQVDNAIRLAIKRGNKNGRSLANGSFALKSEHRWFIDEREQKITIDYKPWEKLKTKETLCVGLNLEEIAKVRQAYNKAYTKAVKRILQKLIDKVKEIAKKDSYKFVCVHSYEKINKRMTAKTKWRNLADKKELNFTANIEQLQKIYNHIYLKSLHSNLKLKTKSAQVKQAAIAAAVSEAKKLGKAIALDALKAKQSKNYWNTMLSAASKQGLTQHIPFHQDAVIRAFKHSCKKRMQLISNIMMKITEAGAQHGLNDACNGNWQFVERSTGSEPWQGFTASEQYCNTLAVAEENYVSTFYNQAYYASMHGFISQFSLGVQATGKALTLLPAPSLDEQDCTEQAGQESFAELASALSAPDEDSWSLTWEANSPSLAGNKHGFFSKPADDKPIFGSPMELEVIGWSQTWVEEYNKNNTIGM